MSKKNKTKTLLSVLPTQNELLPTAIIKVVLEAMVGIFVNLPAHPYYKKIFADFSSILKEAYLAYTETEYGNTGCTHDKYQVYAKLIYPICMAGFVVPAYLVDKNRVMWIYSIADAACQTLKNLINGVGFKIQEANGSTQTFVDDIKNLFNKIELSDICASAAASVPNVLVAKHLGLQLIRCYPAEPIWILHKVVFLIEKEIVNGFVFITIDRWFKMGATNLVEALKGEPFKHDVVYTDNFLSLDPVLRKFHCTLLSSDVDTSESLFAQDWLLIKDEGTTGDI